MHTNIHIHTYRYIFQNLKYEIKKIASLSRKKIKKIKKFCILATMQFAELEKIMKLILKAVRKMYFSPEFYSGSTINKIG